MFFLPSQDECLYFLFNSITFITIVRYIFLILLYCKTLNKSNLSTNQYLLSFFFVPIKHTKKKKTHRHVTGHCLMYSLERHRRCRIQNEKLLTYHVFPMSLPIQPYTGTESYKDTHCLLDCKKKSNRRPRRRMRMDIVQIYKVCVL